MADNSKAVKRLNKELKRVGDHMAAGNDEAYSVGPSGDDMMKWEGMLMGPAGTPYEGGIFQLVIDFPAEYPHKPPKVKFTTNIYHCNVDADGNICLGILKADNWSPVTSMPDLMIQLHSLLSEPNPSDPLRAEIAALYTSDINKFNEEAAKCTKEHAMG